MGQAIGPGDWVEAVGNGGKHRPPRVTGGMPVIGAVYRVSEVMRPDGVRIAGIQAFQEDGREGWWKADCFRPLYRPDPQLIERLISLPANLVEA